MVLAAMTAESLDKRNTRDTSLPSFLKGEGNTFVDENGNTVTLTGALFSDPDGLAEENQWTERYFQAVSDWNRNVVKIPVHPQLWHKRSWEGYIRLLDEAIIWAGELGMYLIIDRHSIGNTVTEVFFKPLYNTIRAETFRFWKTIGERYAGHDVVGLHELSNELTGYNGRLGRLPWKNRTNSSKRSFVVYIRIINGVSN